MMHAAIPLPMTHLDRHPAASQPRSDHDLLAALAAGEPAALEPLVLRHQGLVLAACRRQLPAADADDAAQAVFLVLARKPGQAARAPSLEAWLLRTSRHVSATALRTRRRRTRAEQEAAMQAPSTTTASPSAEESEVLPLLDACLDQLPERERAAITMHYLAGRSHDEVAQALACPKGTVYSLLSRGLERLRGKLARRGAAIAAPALVALFSGQSQAAAIPATAGILGAGGAGAGGATTAAATPAAHALAGSTMAHATLTGLVAPTLAVVLLGGAAAVGVPLLLSTTPAPAPRQPVPDLLPTVVAPTPAPPLADPVVALTPAPGGTRIQVRMLDSQRALARWQASPYPALLLTAWGAWSAARSGPAVERSGFPQLFAQSDQAALDLSFGAGRATAQVVATAAQPETLLAGLQAAGGSATRDGGTIRGVLPLALPRAALEWASANLEPLSAASPVRDAQVDSEATWRPPSPWPAMSPGQTKDGPANRLTVTAGWSFAPFGLLESLHIAGLPPRPAAPGRGADRHLLATLPASALWGVTSAPLAELVTVAPPEIGAALDGWLRDNGQPPWAELGPQVGGALLWAQAGKPQPPLPTLPILTIEVALPQALGEQFLARAAAHHHLTPEDDGSLRTQVGFIGLQVAWRAGWLVLTTHPDGLGGVVRGGGFAGQPGVAAATAELDRLATPAAGDLLLAGASSSGASWSAVTELLSAWLGQVRPEFATFTPDLRAAGQHGFLALAHQGDALQLDAGGLFGGPLSSSAIIGGLVQTVVDSRTPPKVPPSQLPNGQQPAADPTETANPAAPAPF